MKKWLRRIVQGVLLMIMAFSLLEIGDYFYERYKSDQAFNAINKEVGDLVRTEAVSDAGAQVVAAEEEKEPAVDYEALMARLKGINDDVVAYIDIKGSENRYPVVQSDDNDYYLRRGMDKEYSLQGTPFMDFRNQPNLMDQNTILYAHMMNYGDAMFGIFRHYLEQDYVDQQPKTFTLATQEGVYTYRMFSLQHVWATDPYRIPNQEDDAFVEDLVVDYAQSEVDFGYASDISPKDRVVTLSTCTTDHDDEKRIAVVGVLTQVETKKGVTTREEVLGGGADLTWESAIKR